SGDYDGNLGEFRPLNVVLDMLALLARLGHETVAAGGGAHLGSPVAGGGAAVPPPVVPPGGGGGGPFAVPAGPPRRRRARRRPRVVSSRGHPRLLGPPGPSAQALPVVLLHARGQRRSVALRAGRTRLLARVLPPQKRRLVAKPAVPAHRLDRRGAGEDADLLHHGPGSGHAGHGSAGDADGRGDRGLPLASRLGSARL